MHRRTHPPTHPPTHPHPFHPQFLATAGLEFMFNDSLGFLHSCPSNCGTGLRASVHVRLPLLHATGELRLLCDQLALQPRGVHGEHSEVRVCSWRWEWEGEHLRLPDSCSQAGSTSRPQRNSLLECILFSPSDQWKVGPHPLKHWHRFPHRPAHSELLAALSIARV